MTKLKDFVTSLPGQEKPATGTGVITILPGSDSLKKIMDRSCELLCEHVKREATIYKELPYVEDSNAKQEKQKEVHSAKYCQRNDLALEV